MSYEFVSVRFWDIDDLSERRNDSDVDAAA